MDASKVAEEFSQRVTNFYTDMDNFLVESATCWGIYHDTSSDLFGGGSSPQQAKKLNATDENVTDNRIHAHVNVTSAYIDAVAGILCGDQKKIVAYVTEGENAVEKEGLNRGFRYFDAVTSRRSEKIEQTISSLVCGVGATVAELDFSSINAIAGKPVYRNKRNVFFDYGKGGRFSSDELDWCGYTDIVLDESLDVYIEMLKEKKKYLGTPMNTDLFGYVTRYQDDDGLINRGGFHVYFWREYEKVCDIDNLFVLDPEFFLRLAEYSPEAANLLADMAEDLHIDVEQSQITLNKENLKQFKDAVLNACYMAGMEPPEIQYNTRMAYNYYRAEFSDSVLLRMGPAFTRECHPMSFIVGGYDNVRNRPYGMMRTLGGYQMLVNKSVSDAMTYSDRSSTGGNIAISGAGGSINLIRQAVKNAEQVIPADENMKVQNLGLADAGQFSIQCADWLMRSIPVSVGLPPELFGMLSSGDMTSALMGRITKQITSTLSRIAASLERSVLTDGYIIRDLIYEMSRQISDGRMMSLKFALGGEQAVFEMSRSDITRGISIFLTERDATHDEEVEEFQKILELANMLPDAQRARAVPLIIESAPLGKNNKGKIAKALTPQPPSPEQQLMAARQSEASVRLVEAQASQLEGQAKMEAARGDVAERESLLKLDEMVAKIERLVTQAMKDRADTALTMAQTEKTSVETDKAGIEAILSATEPLRQPTVQQ